MQRKWAKTGTEIVFSCPYLKVDKANFQDGLGYSDDFYRIHFKDWVHVIPVDAEDRVLLVELFRFGIESSSLEFPGGQIEVGSDSLETAKKELLEETGYGSSEFQYLGWVHPNPAIQSNKCHFYFAKNIEKVQGQELEPAEDISLKFVPLSSVSNLIKTGEINHSLAVLAYYKYLALSLD